jgi:hypothetical protein
MERVVREAPLARLLPLPFSFPIGDFAAAKFRAEAFVSRRNGASAPNARSPIRQI